MWTEALTAECGRRRLDMPARESVSALPRGRPCGRPCGNQCDISTGTVIEANTPRVAPPSTRSAQREWP